MSTLTPAAQFGLTFLIFTTSILVIVLASFLIKLLIDLSKLINNLDETTTVVKTQLEPTLKELQGTLQSLNSLADSADKQVVNVKKVLSAIMSTGNGLLSKMKLLSGSFANGILAGLKVFTRKK